jgi:hypothetical protein
LAAELIEADGFEAILALALGETRLLLHLAIESAGIARWLMLALVRSSWGLRRRNTMLTGIAINTAPAGSPHFWPMVLDDEWEED